MPSLCAERRAGRIAKPIIGVVILSVLAPHEGRNKKFPLGFVMVQTARAKSKGNAASSCEPAAIL